MWKALSQFHGQATDVQLQKMSVAEHAETHDELKTALKHEEHRYLKETDHTKYKSPIIVDLIRLVLS